MKQKLDTWFFITADYTFGHLLEAQATEVVKKHGGKVLGSVRAPFNTSDFSSFLLQAQASRRQGDRARDRRRRHHQRAEAGARIRPHQERARRSPPCS